MPQLSTARLLSIVGPSGNELIALPLAPDSPTSNLHSFWVWPRKAFPNIHAKYRKCYRKESIADAFNNKGTSLNIYEDEQRVLLGLVKNSDSWFLFKTLQSDEYILVYHGLSPRSGSLGYNTNHGYRVGKQVMYSYYAPGAFPGGDGADLAVDGETFINWLKDKGFEGQQTLTDITQELKAMVHGPETPTVIPVESQETLVGEDLQDMTSYEEEVEKSAADDDDTIEYEVTYKIRTKSGKDIEWVGEPVIYDADMEESAILTELQIAISKEIDCSTQYSSTNTTRPLTSFTTPDFPGSFLALINDNGSHVIKKHDIESWEISIVDAELAEADDIEASDLDAKLEKRVAQIKEVLKLSAQADPKTVEHRKLQGQLAFLVMKYVEETENVPNAGEFLLLRLEDFTINAGYEYIADLAIRMSNTRNIRNKYLEDKQDTLDAIAKLEVRLKNVTEKNNKLGMTKLTRDLEEFNKVLAGEKKSLSENADIIHEHIGNLATIFNIPSEAEEEPEPEETELAPETEPEPKLTGIARSAALDGIEESSGPDEDFVHPEELEADADATEAEEEEEEAEEAEALTPQAASEIV